jgi:hypothetical protein
MSIGGASRSKSAEALRLCTARSVSVSAITAARTWDNRRLPPGSKQRRGLICLRPCVRPVGWQKQAELLIAMSRATIDLGMASRLRAMASEFRRKATEQEDECTATELAIHSIRRHNPRVHRGCYAVIRAALQRLGPLGEGTCCLHFEEVSIRVFISCSQRPTLAHSKSAGAG